MMTQLKLLRTIIFEGKIVRKYCSSATKVTLKHNGKLQGEKLRGEITFNEYLSWKGIPYAKPPIEGLRFKAPVAHGGWTGTRDATKHGNVSMQKVPGKPSKVVGDEDCLFLNVYTPPKRSSNEPYPVMVWVHGGAFTFGSGNSEEFHPELLVNEDVVVVTFNYRLGVLGFLSTEDQHAQGNYGLKDIIMACEWVRDNISSFGGDPSKITLVGESAGAMMIHTMLLSPLCKGLFHKAILQSGSAISTCYLQEHPKEKTLELAERLNIKSKSNKELVEDFMRVDATILAQSVPPWMQREIPKGKYPLTFCTSIEPEDSLDPRAVPDHPRKLLLKNEHSSIPMIIGVNSEEGLYAVTEWQNDPCLFGILNDEPELLLPHNWNIDPKSATAKEMLNQIYRLYFNNEPIRNVNDYTRYISDCHWNYGPYTATRIHLNQQSAPLYFYVFSFSGDLSINKIKRKLTDYEGVIHGDDVPYLFPMSKLAPKMTKDHPSFVTRARLVRMWANFAKHESPTPKVDNLVNVEWPRVSEKEFHYMDIGNELQAKVDPFGERMKVWWDMDQKFRPSS